MAAGCNGGRGSRELERGPGYPVREEVEGGLVRSVLSFRPGTGDHGAVLACRAENSLLPDSGIEDTWTLTVYCKQN